MANETYYIEMLRGNTLKVRIPSKPFRGQQLPDAIFTFRVGDPQYEIWISRYYEQEKNKQGTQGSLKDKYFKS